MDSTLIKTVSGKTFPEDITDFRVQLPVLDKIIEKMSNLKMFFDDYPLYNRSNVHIIIRAKGNPWYSKYVTSSQCPYYKALCKEELQRYIKNARQFFKTTKNEENLYFSSSYGVL